MPKFLFFNIITSQCAPGDEEKFNRWYNEVHIPMLMKCSHVKSATRLKVNSEVYDKPRFVAIYQFESREKYEKYKKSAEYVAAMEELQQSWPGGLDILSRVQYDLIKEWPLRD